MELQISSNGGPGPESKPGGYQLMLTLVEQMTWAQFICGPRTEHYMGSIDQQTRHQSSLVFVNLYIFVSVFLYFWTEDQMGSADQQIRHQSSLVLTAASPEEQKFVINHASDIERRADTRLYVQKRKGNDNFQKKILLLDFKKYFFGAFCRCIFLCRSAPTFQDVLLENVHTVYDHKVLGKPSHTFFSPTSPSAFTLQLFIFDGSFATTFVPLFDTFFFSLPSFPSSRRSDGPSDR